MMAEIVIAVGSSHGPSIQSPPEFWARLGEGDTRDPRFDYAALLAAAKPGLEAEITLDVQRKRHAAAQAALAKLQTTIASANPDVVIVISNAHRIRPHDAHPVFGIMRAGVFPVMKRAEQPFDPDSRFIPEDKRRPEKIAQERPGHAALADHLIGGLIGEGFDVACVDSLPDGVALDDAFCFPDEWLFVGRKIPIVPLMVSRDLPNQATAGRCYDLGLALRRQIALWPTKLRVGLIASGGLSHQIVDEELDREVIAALSGANAATLRGLSRERLNRAPGTPEILNWVVAAAAMAPIKMTLVDYLPCYRSMAGTGHGLTFGYWAP